MFIIVKHLHAAITVDDLEHFIKPVLKGGLFQKTAELKAIKIFTLVDKKGRRIDRHALVRIIPDSEKSRIIKALNRSRLGLQKLVVAEYVIRHWSKDRRAASHFSVPHPQNLRVNDRRRKGLKMATTSEKLEF